MNGVNFSSGRLRVHNKGKAVFGTPPNCLPLILHLGRSFEIFFFSFSLFSPDLPHGNALLPTLVCLVGEEVVYEKIFLKASASGKAENPTPSAPSCSSADETFSISETDFFFFFHP